MRNHHDVTTELERLAADRAPAAHRIRADLATRAGRRAKRRRNTAWIAAAAAVVLVAGGTTAGAGLWQHQPDISAAASGGGSGPQAGSDSGHAPGSSVSGTGSDSGSSTGSTSDDASGGDSGSSADAAVTLVPASQETVTTPVTATVPDGLTGRVWQQKPGALAVIWFDVGALQQVRDAAVQGSSAPADGVPQVGYVITTDRDGHLHTLNSSGSPSGAAPQVDSSPITVGGHDATLEICPRGTVDTFGSYADSRITWQLSDGRWIHVWAAGGAASADAAPSAMLTDFAASIVETPQTLPRSPTMGLTLPGFDHVSSTNEQQLPGYDGTTIYQCPDGVDPLQVSDGTRPPCLIANIGHHGVETSSSHMAEGTVITVGDMDVHVLDSDSIDFTPAWASLDDGLMVQVTVPNSVNLSRDQIARLVASVHLGAGQ